MTVGAILAVIAALAPTTVDADTVTYEVTGSADTPLTVTYLGSEGEVDTVVDELPWSVQVSPAPDAMAVSAIATDLGRADVTLTISLGDDVLESCLGGATCIAPAAS